MNNHNDNEDTGAYSHKVSLSNTLAWPRTSYLITVTVSETTIEPFTSLAERLLSARGQHASS